jgi:endogenous inhibitor of DNA gyrase (YacG/DUF329 family)
MVSTVMRVHCATCGEKAEVEGMDMGPDRSPELGVEREDHDTSGALHDIDCPKCGIRTQRVTPQGS